MCCEDQTERNHDIAPRSSACEEIEEKATVSDGLISKNPQFCWFLLSYLVTNCGEWLTYVASMSLVDTVADERKHILVTALVVSHLFGNTAFSYVGGMLADRYDRKTVMIILDITGVCVALLYLLAMSSIPVLFLCVTLQSGLAGMYEPSRSAILPSLVGTEYLERANQIVGILWSVGAALGSAMGGLVVMHYGVSVCFMLDSVLYLTSACILVAKVQTYEIICDNEEQSSNPNSDGSSLWELLARSNTTPYLFIKGSAALIYGAASVLNVSFAEVDSTTDSQRFGWLQTAIGIGCLVAPLTLVEGRCHLKVSVASFVIMATGYGCVGLTSTFWLKCSWTAVKAAGSLIVWVDSTILLQKFTPTSILGRVLAIDYALSTLGEATSVVLAGALQDHMSADFVAIIFSCGSMGLALMWTVIFVRHEAAPTEEKASMDIELEPLHSTGIA